MLNCEFYMGDIIVVKERHGIIGKVVGHKIYESGSIGYMIKLYNNTVPDSVYFNGEDEDMEQTPMRKATSQEIGLYNGFGKKFERLTMERIDIACDMEDLITF